MTDTTETTQGSELKEAAQSRRLLTPAQTLERIPWSRQTLWRKVGSGEFPSPIDLGGGRQAFWEDEIDTWLSNRPRVADRKASAA